MHARQKLKERYGSMFDVEMHKLFKKYADYLQQCVSGMQSIKELKILNDPQINEQLCEKLPEWIKRKWAGKVYQTQKSEQRYPGFNEFACFITEEAELQSLPLFNNKASNPPSSQKRMYTQANNKIKVLFGKPYEDRINFLRSKNLCYACGEPGHGWQICKMKNKNNCRKCNKPGHPTCLHKTKEDWSQQHSSIIPDSQESFNSKAETSSHTDMNTDKTGASLSSQKKAM
ncbi:hypothetical protein EB796_015744 [Bugula neritina]|uniref:CCHC-type domain-containing protein n=1 Tax=Bugula neritina TaxID=10212 RepID=A0A7J7JKR6_BUGNE|nr:hypothetical protein EB796_015744 [Bugula neritina]